MIRNIPKWQEFESLGVQCITKSFEMLYAVWNKYSEYSEMNDSLGEYVTLDKYWEHNNITVRTSLIVLFQGIEYMMKMVVSQESPLLLIENNRSEWPSLPKKTNKDFDELQTISGENLLSVFCAVSNNLEKLDDFVTKFEEIRVMRNKLVHSTNIRDIKYKFVVKESLYFLSFFYPPFKWIELYRKMFTSEPTFGYWDSDIENAMFFKVLNFIEHSLSKGEINKYLPYNIRSRRYLCPSCTYWLNKDYIGEVLPKWAFLNPNKADSTTIHCMICEKQYKVKREECQVADCKGNVLSMHDGDKICLTCYEIN